MCLACEMEAMWFAAMEARAAAAAVPQATLLPVPEGGRVGEGEGARGDSAGPLPSPPLKQGEGAPRRRALPARRRRPNE
jgi:hypothetical protein